MSTTTKNPRKLITPKVRFCFVHVFKPRAMEEDGEGEKKYMVTILIPKKDKALVAKIEAAVNAAKEEGKTKWGGKIPAKLKLPLRDGDEDRQDDPAFAGHYFLNATAKTKPGVVDANLDEILDQDEVYSGIWGRASITFFAFDMKGNRGVACGLNNLQKLEDGENLGGRASAAADFGDEDEDLL